MERVKLSIRPCTLPQANEMIERLHRHHKKVIGHRFSISVVDPDEVVRGVAVVGRPKARMTDQFSIAEVDRVCTDGTPNACSALYGACARIAKEMGFASIQTFILDSETGTSLRASGWEVVSTTSGGEWDTPTRRRRPADNSGPKQKWVKVLR